MMPGTVATAQPSAIQHKTPTDALTRRARVRIAWRLLPFVSLLYLVQHIDRFNVSFAALRMKAELGLSDSAYGFGASIFVFAYAVFEIPGVILIERWSARKWVARIMVSWGMVTVLTAFIHSAAQFYLVRFFLGAAEASFFPGIIVYLTHWFTTKDRARAVAAFYVAAPVAVFLGSAIAGSVLGVHWLGISGWRWLFIIEGIPAILLGVVTFFYLTDRPAQGKWLPADECSWITSVLATELAAKNRRGRLSFLDACKDSRMLLLVAGYFFFLMGSITNAFWLPTFLQRLSNLPPPAVAKLVMLASIGGILGLILNSWSTDKSGEYKWHTIVPVLAAGCCYLFVSTTSGQLFLVEILFTLYYFFSQSVYPSFWGMPAMFLSESTAAAAFGLIASVGALGSFLGPSIVGYLNDRTHSIHLSLIFTGCSFLASALILSFVRVSRRFGD
jgi:ACS family tartrate transporter-like MFS transporter